MKKSERLVKLLEDALRLEGIEPFAVTIYAATGFYRTSPWADGYRWTGHCNNYLYSFDGVSRMTDCCRYGIKMEQEGTNFEVYAKTP